MPRSNVPELDVLLDKEIPVLDKGFIRVIDYMGTDVDVAEAARISYNLPSEADKRSKVSVDKLLRHLMRHEHGTPFEMCEIKLHIRIPMDAWRQMVRHRTASINEYSTRYSEAIDDKQETSPDKWRLQATGNKQGSSGYLTEWVGDCPFRPTPILEPDAHPPGVFLSLREKQLHDMAVKVYDERLALGVAKEQARKDLPLSTYTEAYWKCDLRNVLHFLGLRMDSHAQEEIRAYANVMGYIVSKWCPIAWAAFNDYHHLRGALLLSARDVKALSSTEAAIEYGWIKRTGNETKISYVSSNRELAEALSKYKRLGVVAVWQTLENKND